MTTVRLSLWSDPWERGCTGCVVSLSLHREEEMETDEKNSLTWSENANYDELK